jgi:transcriptional regulator with XRE-family HTH domain
MREGNQSGHRSKVAVQLGELLKSGREAAGLTLTEAAAKVGVSRTYWSRLERGEYANPTMRLLTRIARELPTIRIEDLYAVTDQIPPTDLPSLGPYLRAKYPDWPYEAITDVTKYCDFIKHRYSLP